MTESKIDAATAAGIALSAEKSRTLRAAAARTWADEEAPTLWDLAAPVLVPVVTRMIPWILRFQSGRDFWELSAGLWPMMDVAPHAEFAELHRRHRASWSPECMELMMRHFYDRLPAEVDLWRSQPAGLPLGLRWTNSRYYAEQYRLCDADVLHWRRVPKSSIAFCCKSNDSRIEVILFEPPANLSEPPADG
jgi:hypothetical protein